MNSGANLDQRGNILKEVSIMRQLNHPNITSLLEFQESRDYYFLVLELASGGELFHQIVRLTYFSEDLARHVILQVAKGIRYLHEEKGVVHRYKPHLSYCSNYSCRDIKPENLLFEPIPFIPSRNPKPGNPEDEDKEDEGEYIPGIGAGGIGKIKIADFGLSKIVWDSQTMTPCGTVGYTAPEIVKDERYSKSVDMWALGCVLYTLLCGFPPFYDESIQALTEKVARGQYTFLSPWWDSISKSAKDLISHLLTVDPVRRYTIDEFLHHPWVRESGEETTPAFDAPSTTLNLDKGEFIEPMDGVEDTSLAAGIPPNIRAAMQAGTQPLTPGAKAVEFRSPGSVSLREVFDVSYAVHRMEEERGRRGRGRGFGNLNAPDEDEEDAGLSAVLEADESTDEGSSAEDVPPPGKKKASVWNHVAEDQLSAMQRDMQKAAISKEMQHHHRRKQPAAAASGMTSTTAKKSGAARTGGFQLNMEAATLLSRRGKGPDGGDAAKAASKTLKVES
jgi:serine/threonine protein kinase